MLKHFFRLVCLCLVLSSMPVLALAQEKNCIKEHEDVELSGKIVYRTSAWPDDSGRVSRGYVLMLITPRCFDYISRGERDLPAQAVITEAMLYGDNPLVKSNLSRFIKVKGRILPSWTVWHVSDFLISFDAVTPCQIAPKDKSIAKC